MSSAVFITSANSSGDMRPARYSPFVFNWRIAIGLCLSLVIILVYRFSSSSKRMSESQGFIEWEGQQGLFYRKASPASANQLTVLLLHGQAFSSQTWEELGTLKFLSSMNYVVVAVDLPGYGNSKNIEIPKTSQGRSEFLQRLIAKLQIERSVVVSPSMSGSFSLPYIFQSDQARSLGGFIPVAPVGTEKFTELSYKKLDLPTLIIYGENDTGLGLSSLDRLKDIPGSVIHMIKNAGHACYLGNNREEFHATVLKFLEKLQ